MGIECIEICPEFAKAAGLTPEEQQKIIGLINGSINRKKTIDGRILTKEGQTLLEIAKKIEMVDHSAQTMKFKRYEREVFLHLMGRGLVFEMSSEALQKLSKLTVLEAQEKILDLCLHNMDSGQIWQILIDDLERLTQVTEALEFIRFHSRAGTTHTALAAWYIHSRIDDEEDKSVRVMERFEDEETGDNKVRVLVKGFQPPALN